MVPSFSLPAEADFSFLAEEEPVAARAEAAALVQGLAWLPASVEEARAYFEGAELGAARAAAAPFVGAVVAGLVAAAVGALAADALAAEHVAGAAGEPELACSALAALAADELAAELVAGARAAALPVWLQADWRAVDCDSAEYSAARWAACLAAEPRWAVAVC